MKKILLPLTFAIFCLVTAAQKNYLVVGTYTGGKSEGIYVYNFNSTNGDFDSVSMIKTSNPSYVAISPDEKFVYAAQENADNGHGGAIAAFGFDKKTGQLAFINQQPSGGDDPCYVSVDKNGKWLSVANYTSGSLSIIPINKDGGLNPATTVIKHSGYSVNSERQQGPHVHSTVFSKDNKYLFVSDLGIDKLMIYTFNQNSGSLSEAGAVITEPGAGPRHFTFHPNNKYVYLLQEMSGKVSAYKYSNGKFSLLQDISALPPDYLGPVGSADIHTSPDGKFLYASNRGESNTIAIFSINQKTGWITPLGHQSTMGKIPRNFNFDPTGNFLLVGNQESDDIVIFKVDKKTGLLTDTGKRINVGKPVCIKWIMK